MRKNVRRISTVLMLSLLLFTACSNDKTEQVEKKVEIQSVRETEEETTTLKIIVFNNYIVTSNDYVNIRKEPNTESQIVDKVYKNTLIDLTETEDINWYQTEDGNYVAAEYVELSNDKEEEYQQYQLSQKYVEAYGVITESSGNVRNLPDQEKGDIVGNIVKGVTFEVIGKCSNEWYMVNFNGSSCYISNEVMKIMTKEEYMLYNEVPHKGAFDESSVELIGTYTTDYSPAASNRGYNVEKASGEIDCLVFNPGAMFNWCRDMGACGQEEGYKSSTEISNGQYVTGYGGGICQISSTLCAAITESSGNFEFVERHQHSKPQKYIPRELDATVSYPSTNLIIKNNNDYSVMLKSYFSNGNVTVEVYKIK